MRWLRMFGAVGVGIITACSSYSTADSSASSTTDAGANDAATNPSTDDGAAAAQTNDGGGVQVSALPEAVCNTRIADADTGVFVRVDTGADSDTCGAVDVPCKSIKQGIARATTLTRANVYVGAGLYTESVDLAMNIAVIGGWTVAGASWTPDCGANNATTVKIQATDDAAIRAKGVASALSYATVNSVATATSAQTLYGVFASDGASLALDNVTFAITAGGAGIDATLPISDPAPAPATCAAGDGSSPSAAPAAGAPGGAGSFTETGFAPGTTGTAGGAGTAGGNGTAAPTPQPFSNTVCTATCVVTTDTVVANGGSNGCGGAGGTGGPGGTAGGSSIGIFASNATITVTRTAISVAAGGKGGAGANGTPGGNGSAGLAGATKSYGTAPGGECTPNGTQQSVPQSFTPQIAPNTCTNSNALLPGGAAGGKGGTGTSGARGGGGAGGWSIGIATFGTGTVTTAPDTTIAVGSPGAGGAPNGTVGNAAPHYP